MTEALPSPTEYRAALREWLAVTAEHLQDGAPTHSDRLAEIAAQQRLTRTLWDAGWKRYGWPTSEGGAGGGPAYRAVLYDELCQAGVPVPETDYVLEVLADPTRGFAPELAQSLLPAFHRGDELWAQCFSEPDAGSDLASLRTRAVRDGDAYIVNGQKVWTTNGVAAQRLFTLVRTGSTQSRHRGITALLIDADSPGVSVQPLTFASGSQEMAECHFDDVRVPCSRRVGDEDDGWRVAMRALEFERGMYAWMRQAWLLAKVRQMAARAEPVDTATADALGSAYHAVISLRSRSLQTVRRLDRGLSVGPDASVDKILLASAEQLVMDVARHLSQPEFEIGSDARDLRQEWWYSRAASIYGGSGEIQRGIIADRVLRLPAEIRTA
ncbi:MULTISPECIES: acyl-CoA dehydrogenase family protein [unclassified Mycobacterium]|uniref:acyl-CoA dehydrogenase family protein n=1 Tax=unclassified Mycobacterium TaxID=2642494 RepID=UPI0029C8ACC3|nr:MULTISPECIES: acyl-CoA dehydrogenase family protein [unclassified Mycobacterium]